MSHLHLNPRRAVVAGTVALALVAAACGSDEKSSSTTGAAATTAASATIAGATTTPAGAASAIPQALIDGAKEEGKVNLIALPDDWANYKGILASFTANYGVRATVAIPDASSADELTAVETLQGPGRHARAPSTSGRRCTEAVAKGYVETYKPTARTRSPTTLKDPDGQWVAAYYGVMAIALEHRRW